MNSGGKSLLRQWISSAGLVTALSSRVVGAQLPAPRLQAIVSSGSSSVVLQVSSQPGSFYTLQHSADLVTWSSLTTLLAGAEPLTWTNPPSPASMVGFFRAEVNPPNRTVVTHYHGWTNVVMLNNGLVEAVIVPNAGRVLQFRFLGATNGPFWENAAMNGQSASPSSWNIEGAFGGDKAWPSPQSDWGWPPPVGFDGSPDQIQVTNGVVTLAGPVEPAYGIRMTRTIELGFNAPLMRITTVFERVAATPRTNNPVGIWTITQAVEPVGCFVPVRSPSVFAGGYKQLGNGMPAQFQNTNGLLSFARDPSASHKLGFDADSLVWIGTNLGLRIDAPRAASLPVTSYPDGGCSTEIYTNPGTNAPYVELECLAPLSPLPVGARIQSVTTYTLFKRTETDPQAEARRILNLTQPGN